jgi:hypothetical protein
MTTSTKVVYLGCAWCIVAFGDGAHISFSNNVVSSKLWNFCKEASSSSTDLNPLYNLFSTLATSTQHFAQLVYTPGFLPRYKKYQVVMTPFKKETETLKNQETKLLLLLPKASDQVYIIYNKSSLLMPKALDQVYYDRKTSLGNI